MLGFSDAGSTTGDAVRRPPGASVRLAAYDAIACGDDESECGLAPRRQGSRDLLSERVSHLGRCVTFDVSMRITLDAAVAAAVEASASVMKSRFDAVGGLRR